MVLSHCMAIKQVHSLHERYPFPFLSKTWKARAYMASGRQRRASKAWNSVKEIFLKKNNSEENVSSVPINIYYVCVFSLSLSRHNNINNKMVNSSYPSLEVSTLEANSFNVYSSQFSPRKPRYLCMRSP